MLSKHLEAITFGSSHDFRLGRRWRGFRSPGVWSLGEQATLLLFEWGAKCISVFFLHQIRRVSDRRDPKCILISAN